MLARRLEPIDWLLPLSVVGLGAIIGLLSAADPALGVAAAVGIAFLLVALTSLARGVVAYTFLTFVALLPGFAGPGVNVTKGAGAVLAISWLAKSTAGDNPRAFAADHPALTVFLILDLAWNAVSAIWALSIGSVEVSTISFALNFALFPIVYAAVGTKQDVRNIIGAFILGAILSAAYGVAKTPNVSALASSTTAASGLDRLSGTIKDPNELATVLAAGTALSTALIFDRTRSSLVRLGSVLGAGLLILGMLLTLSRGGLVAFGAGLVAWILVASHKRIQSLLVAGGVVAIILWFFVAIAPPEARDRITRADGGSGRTDIWHIGWRMVKANPVKGVGSGNFPDASVHYLIAPGAVQNSTFIGDAPTVAHNAYLEVLAETGVIGLTLFVAVVGGCLATAVKATRNFARKHDREGELLGQAVVIATACVLAGYFFLSDERSKYLWLLLSLGPALLTLSRRRDAET